MAEFKQNYFQKKNKDRGPRSNNRILSPEVQVISSDGENLGILNTNEAINKAKNEGLDLIEIAPNANPPVCKIMDMGKYKYDAQKKANLAKKKQKVVSLKEIKLRPGTEVHDYNFKIKNAKKFITKGDIIFYLDGLNYHHHLPSFKFWLAFNFCNIFCFFNYSVH